MKLEPGERSILASFTSWTRAEDAVKALKEAGLGTVQLARAGKYAGVNDNSDFNDPVRSQAATLSGLTQLEGDEFPSRNAGPLIAADPAASGMSGPRVDERSVLLTAVVSQDQVDQAVAIIKQNEGRV